MAARFWNLLCLIGVFNQLIPRSQPPITKLQSSKNFCYLLSINGESNALGTRNFPPFPGPLFRPSLKRIESSVHAINYSISKLSKHGSTALILPGRLFWIDLTIHMDIQCNPGPDRLENICSHRITAPEIWIIALQTPLNIQDLSYYNCGYGNLKSQTKPSICWKTMEYWEHEEFALVRPSETVNIILQSLMFSGNLTTQNLAREELICITYAQ